jgi:membrane-associated phospholipid phosphatase
VPKPRNPTKTRFARSHPKSYLGLHASIGLILAALSTWAFFAIADEVPEKGWMVHVDAAVTAWLQTHGTELGESIFVGISFLGAQVLAALLLVVAVTLVVRRDWRQLVVLAATCGGGALLNVALKQAFHRARPSFASEFAVTSWSFPSGHAMDSLIGYGLFAYWLGARFPRSRTPILIGGVALVVAIGYARIYLGVHYLSDVFAGYAAGLIWLTVCITGYRFAEHSRVGPNDTDKPEPHAR